MEQSSITPVKRSYKYSNINAIFEPPKTPLKKYSIHGDFSQIKIIKLNFLQKISLAKNNFNSTNSIFSSDKKNLETTRNPKINEKINKLKQDIKKSGLLSFEVNSEEDEHSENQDNNSKKNIKMSKEFSREFMYKLFTEGALLTSNNRNDNLNNDFYNKFNLPSNCPFVLSYTRNHPFSMLYETKYEPLYNKKGILTLPAPRFIDSNEWMKTPDLTLDSVFHGLKLEDKVGLEIVDPEVMKKYKGLVGDIIIQILKIPFGHHISLKIKMFEPHCLLQRITSIFGNANHFLIPAADKNITALERFKLVITFIVSGFYLPVQQLKPFNPFVGETFQGEFPNGAILYVEQVSHTPLAARFLLRYKKVYELNGYVCFSVKSEGFGSSMFIHQKGPINIIFPEINEKITFNLPSVKIVNAKSEKGRANQLDGSSIFCDTKNRLKGVIRYSLNKDIIHEMKGNIFNYDFDSNFKYDVEKELEFAKKFKVGRSNKSYKILSEISGSYLDRLIFNNRIYWNIRETVPEFIRPVKSCLPSDGRFREDLIWLYRSFYCANNEEERKLYLDIAQEWKIMMEEFNRWERKHRADYKKKMKLK